MPPLRFFGMPATQMTAHTRLVIGPINTLGHSVSRVFSSCSTQADMLPAHTGPGLLQP